MELGIKNKEQKMGKEWNLESLTVQEFINSLCVVNKSKLCDAKVVSSPEFLDFYNVMASCGHIVLTDLGQNALETFPKEVNDLTDDGSGLPKVKPR